MAAEDDITLVNPEPVPFYKTPFGRNIMLGAGISAVVVAMIVVWLWTQKQEDVVLFSNINDRDGGAIIAALTQMNVPYKHADGGGAILVPADKVHDARLRLAAQGLPKGGNVGFELLENQKLGVSQFLERVNIQRATEGELAETIGKIGAVQSVRVHLALPKETVFVREQQKPTASVLLTLHRGRALDRGQVQAIVHLVASSVPEMPTSGVTVVDQDGNLLSDPDKNNNKGLDPNQLKYVLQLQQNIVKQVESIIIPIVGEKNVRAEATADIDFAQTDQATETFRPNQPPEKATIRSMQTSEAINGQPPAAGIPGALTNQPPAPNTAPLTADGTTSTTTSTATGSSRRDATTNFEVDKTVRYSQQGMGGIKRLTVGVVLNYKRTVDKKTGKVTITPLTEQQKAEITRLVKEAMGFNPERGDSVNVSNIPFDGVDKPDPVPDPIPWWKDKENWDLALKVGKFLLGAILLSYLFFKLLRPMLRPIFRKLDEITAPPPPPVEVIPEETEEDIAAKTALQEMEERQAIGYRENLQMAKNLAKEDPRVVANVIKAWVGANE